MARELEEVLRALLGNTSELVTQADLIPAAALARQELSFRQRAGAAAARLRRARGAGASESELAELDREVKNRTARMEATAMHARAAALRRPLPDRQLAQVFGRAQGTLEKPPLTLAALSVKGEAVAHAVARDNLAFHLTFKGDLNDVVLQLSDGAGRVVYREERPVTVPAGTVYYLDVALGAPEPEPGPIPKQATMPELVGHDRGVALELLRRLGVSEVATSEKTGDGPAGIVIAQSPEGGTELSARSKVALTVRRSRARATKVLPSFVNATRAEAEQKLKELGLTPSIKDEPHDGPSDIVLAQTPAEGTSLSELSTVELTISAKREAPPEMVVVPDLLGKPVDLARELLKATDLRAEIKDTADARSEEGVIEQDPKPGTTVKRRATVSLVVNTPPEQRKTVIVPSLKGRDLGRARTMLESLGLAHDAQTAPSTAPEGQVIDQKPEAKARVDAGSRVGLTVSAGPATDPSDRRALTALTREMARDQRSEEHGLSAKSIARLLDAGGIGGLQAAEALSELSPEDLRDRLRLSNKTAALRFRAVLRKALKARRG